MGRKRPFDAGAIVARVMDRYKLKTCEIPQERPFNEDMIADDSIDRSKRYFLKKSQAGFVCLDGADREGKTICHQWSSYQASAVIDLFAQRVILVGKQGCRICDDEDNFDEWKNPHFGEKAIEEMAERAVEQCLEKLGRLERRIIVRGGHRYGRRAPHDEQRCRLCRIKGRRCC